MKDLEIVDDKLKETYQYMDTFLIKEIINYSKNINKKNSKNSNTTIKDKQIIYDSYVNSEY